MNEWNIQSRAHACQTCERAFVDKENYHTLLFSEKSELLRLDVCMPCWDSKYSQGKSDRKGFVSHWQGVYHAPPPAPVDPIQKESAETLLRKLIEQNDPKYGPACFILAVMLERKRLLKVKEQLKRDGARVFVYEHPKTGDIFTITDPDLQLDQLDEVQRTVADLLEHGLEPTPGSAPVAAQAVPQPDVVPASNSLDAAPAAEQAAGTDEPAATVPESAENGQQPETQTSKPNI